ncbi:hypothetical protein SAMN05444417_3263 [Wenxinia saemankumensis]|uniref:Uncharacterized protein n=1 Tax=Wenxinia saemankumensis TaxID=1447782 RepID=A0A1M6HJR5_9RHOB|nr:hypothetical protein SAMN05444417_3263 [Wenxinia saemankumensis]
MQAVSGPLGVVPRAFPRGAPSAAPGGRVAAGPAARSGGGAHRKRRAAFRPGRGRPGGARRPPDPGVDGAHPRRPA